MITFQNDDTFSIALIDLCSFCQDFENEYIEINVMNAGQYWNMTY